MFLIVPLRLILVNIPLMWLIYVFMLQTDIKLFWYIAAIYFFLQANLIIFLAYSIGGLILDFTVSNFKGIAVFQPVINGVGGNLVAVQASRISTSLHRDARLGKLPHYVSSICLNPISVFFSQGKHYYYYTLISYSPCLITRERILRCKLWSEKGKKRCWKFTGKGRKKGAAEITLLRYKSVA